LGNEGQRRTNETFGGVIEVLGPSGHFSVELVVGEISVWAVAIGILGLRFLNAAKFLDRLVSGLQRLFWAVTKEFHAGGVSQQMRVFVLGGLH
jgi:hypothetical protein